MNNEEKRVVSLVQKALTPDLIRSEYRDRPENPLYGHCCHASVATFLLLGGKARGYSIWKAIDPQNVLHYWCTDAAGNIVDPTAAQYYDFGREPPYSSGRRTGYRMSNAIATILERVRAAGGTS